MKRRIVGIVLAVLLAGGGTVALVGYVQAAKRKAVSSEVLTTVYMVDSRIAKGAKAADIRAAVSEEQVPTRLKQSGAITDLAAVDGKVAAIELLPGEQLVAARLATASAADDAPADLLRISVLLEPERSVGGQLKAGDTVGVFLSFDPFEADAAGVASLYDPTATTALPEGASTTVAGARKTPNMTHLEFQKVVVTSVQLVQVNSSGGTLGKATDKTDDGSALPISNDKYVVTLALDVKRAEQLVFAAEYGHVWLASEAAEVDESGTRVVSLGNVYTASMR